MNRELDFALARFNNDGSLDTSFGSGGEVTTDFGGNGDVSQAIAIRMNGRGVSSWICRGGRGSFRPRSLTRPMERSKRASVGLAG